MVTGAGSGIGRAIALDLAGRGYALALVGRRRAPLEETGAACGGAFHVIRADLREAAAAAGIVDECLARFGRLDVLVNNAGSAPVATIPQTTPGLASDVFAVNAVAPCVTTARAWSVFERQFAVDGVGGVVVSISSMAAWDPFDGLYAYAGAKLAVHSLTRSAAKQGAAIGVRAFVVAPGAVETPLLRTIVDEAALPRSRTLAPGVIAAVVRDCVEGKRDGDNGGVIWVVSG